MKITNEAKILFVTGAFAVGTVTAFIFGYTTNANFLTVLGIAVGMGLLLAAISLGISAIIERFDEGGWEFLFGAMILTGFCFTVYLCIVAPWTSIGYFLWRLVLFLALLAVVGFFLFLFYIGISDQFTRTRSTPYTPDTRQDTRLDTLLDSSERLPPEIWIPLAKSIRRRDKNTCDHCGGNGRSLGIPMDVHHEVPLSEGGTNREENLITLCRDCHEVHHGYSFDDGE